MAASAGTSRDAQTRERLASLETRMGQTNEKIDHLTHSVEQLTHVVSQQAISAGRTDWKMVLSAIGVAIAFMAALGNMALTPISANLKALDVTLQREMRLLDDRAAEQITAVQDRLENHENESMHTGAFENVRIISERIARLEAESQCHAQ